MGRGGRQEEENLPVVLSRCVGDDVSSSTSSASVLHFCMLGCETKPPYGPNPHTAQLLLDLLCQAASRLGLSTRILMDIYNVQAEEYPTADHWEDDSYYDGFLLPGSFSSAYETAPWIETMKQTLQERIVTPQRPCLAICFGHQVLAHSFQDDGLASKVPTGARVGRHTAMCTAAGTQLLQCPTLDLFLTHGDQVEKLPPTALNLAGNDVVPIQAAAYFGSVQEAEAFQRQGNKSTVKPYAISFQAHPEYATSEKLGLEQTLGGCMIAMEKLGHIDSVSHVTAKKDAREQYKAVQQDSIHAMVQAGRWLGWFPESCD